MVIIVTLRHKEKSPCLLRQGLDEVLCFLLGEFQLEFRSAGRSIKFHLRIVFFAALLTDAPFQ